MLIMIILEMIHMYVKLMESHFNRTGHITKHTIVHNGEKTSKRENCGNH